MKIYLKNRSYAFLVYCVYRIPPPMVFTQQKVILRIRDKADTITNVIWGAEYIVQWEEKLAVPYVNLSSKSPKPT